MGWMRRGRLPNPKNRLQFPGQNVLVVPRTCTRDEFTDQPFTFAAPPFLEERSLGGLDSSPWRIFGVRRSPTVRPVTHQFPIVLGGTICSFFDVLSTEFAKWTT